MVRFGSTRLVSGLALIWLLGCGDKQNPLGDSPAPGQSDSGQSDSIAVVSYTETIAPMMAASCTLSGCHGGASPLMGIGLDTYEGVKAFAAESNAAIQAKTMPIPPGADLTDTDRENFDAWVKAGAPNN